MRLESSWSIGNGPEERERENEVTIDVEILYSRKKKKAERCQGVFVSTMRMRFVKGGEINVDLKSRVHSITLLSPRADTSNTVMKNKLKVGTIEGEKIEKKGPARLDEQIFVTNLCHKSLYENHIVTLFAL